MEFEVNLKAKKDSPNLKPASKIESKPIDAKPMELELTAQPKNQDKYYLIHLGKEFGQVDPIVLNNSLVKELNAAEFQIEIPFALPSQDEFISEDYIQGSLLIDGKALENQSKVKIKCGLFNDISEAIRVAERALKRSINFDEFKSIIDRISPDMKFRSMLMDALFEQAKGEEFKDSREEEGSGDDLVDQILMQTESGQSAIEKATGDLLSNVGAQSGHRLNETTAKQFISKMKEWLGSFEEALFSNEQTAELFSMVVSLSRIIRASKSRMRQHVILFSDNQEKVQKLMEENSIIRGLWSLGTCDSEKVESIHHEFETICFRLASPDPGAVNTYFFQGNLFLRAELANFVFEGKKPAHMAFLEGLLKQDLKGWATSEGWLTLEDQDVYPLDDRGAVVDRYSIDEASKLRNEKVNVPVGVKKSDSVLFMEPQK